MHILVTSHCTINVPISSEEILFTDSVVANKIISRSITKSIVTACAGLCRKSLHKKGTNFVASHTLLHLL